MKISLVGVLEDGSPRRFGTPTDPRTTIEMVAGTDLTIDVSIVSPSGAPVRLSGVGTSLLFTIKKYPYQRPPILSKTAALSGNVGTFSIGHSDLRQWPVGLYNYDVWLTIASARNVVVPLSPFLLQPSVADVPWS